MPVVLPVSWAAVRLPVSVRLPVMVKAAVPGVVTAPAISRSVASFSAKLLAVKLPSDAIWLLPVSVVAPVVLPVSWAAVRLPVSVRLPAMVKAAVPPVVTAPAISRSAALVMASPLVAA